LNASNRQRVGITAAALRGALATDCAACGVVVRGPGVSCEECGSLDIWPVDVVDCLDDGSSCSDPHHRAGTRLHVRDAAG
jgi:hypothetical protein